jgi:RNA polymerase sigma-70 factor, ECF subfamily
MTRPSDERELAIIKRATDGDMDAYGELYSLFVDRIYRYVFYQVKDKMLAEDITEDIFVKAWKVIKNCRGREETFSAWLYRVAHNQVVDVIRKNHRFVSLEGIEISDGRDPAEEADKRLAWQSVMEIVALLPEPQKQLILLKFLNDADNIEISKIMGRGLGAVRALQMRALDNLRRKLSAGVKNNGR